MLTALAQLDDMRTARHTHILRLSCSHESGNQQIFAASGHHPVPAGHAAGRVCWLTITRRAVAKLEGICFPSCALLLDIAGGCPRGGIEVGVMGDDSDFRVLRLSIRLLF